jgi:sugar phosphate permease
VAERKERMALLSRYSKLHTIRYESKPAFNINVEQWAADGLVESYGLPSCYELLDYYFSVAENPTWKYFANYAHKIVEARSDVEEDLRERAERRKLAERWLNE